MDRKAARRRADRAARAGRHSGAGEPAVGLSAPAVRRHEPARDDRHGDRLQSAPPDRRRADHGARRHHPGADPRPAAVACSGARHGAGADHPQHGRGRRDGAARRGDVCRPGHGGARRRRAVRRAAASLHRGAARGAAGAQRRRAAGSPRFPASCPACYDRPQGCLFSPRCAYATAHSRRVRPELRAWQGGQVRCHYPLGDPDRASGASRPTARVGARGRRDERARRRSATTSSQTYEIRRGLFRAPARLQAVGGVSFAHRRRPTLAVVGESGCGKSTLARMVTLIEQPTAGTLTLDGIDAVDPPPARARRGCAARCRSCSRTPTARSTRARRSARSSKSRWPSTPTLGGAERTRAGARR